MSKPTVTVEFKQQTDIRPFLCDKCLAKVEAPLTADIVDDIQKALVSLSLEDLLCNKCAAKIRSLQ